MSFLLSPIVLLLVLPGLWYCTKELYQFLKNRKVNNAGMLSLIAAGIFLGVMAAPHLFGGLILGWLTYVVAVLYLTFIVVGIWRLCVWAKFIRAIEDNDPDNDPHLPGADHKDCSCPHKKDEEGPKAPPASGPESKGTDSK